MSLRTLRFVEAPKLQSGQNRLPVESLWEGFLTPHEITLLRGDWGIGKTTLVTGLFHPLATGGSFLGRKVRSGKVLIISEDSDIDWCSRVRVQPFGDNVRILPQPYNGGPTIDDWNEIIRMAVESRQRGELDLFVVDTIFANMPVNTMTNKRTIDETFEATRRLADSGVAVLLLEHSGLSNNHHDYVDNILELKWAYRAKGKSTRRMLKVRPSRSAPASQLTYEWDRQTGDFTVVENAVTELFEPHWKTLDSLLKKHPQGLTIIECVDLLASSSNPPSNKTIYRWLKKAHELKRVQRTGTGSKSSPFRYSVLTIQHR